ncbi:hypothetical protein [Brochothrix campestris]|uniref:Cell surface protein n=1 Tax=Brochothrix campestris FSL F6-1037 TaxID=1265861 RepID=W7CJ19_9LIST|nr:hypothetical protein [Brochothrix campestris]EUJ39354.1 hypothetical protein BCAMP_07425 [Brochothrix campestris FSL F6-1037]
MKKGLQACAAAVLVGTMVVGAGTSVFAYEGQDVVGENAASIQTKGLLGNSDNTDPGETLPEGSDKWINVTLPTAVVFNSDETTDNKTITSPSNYQVMNNSGRGVKVSLTSFDTTSGHEALTKLTLAPAGNGQQIPAVDLIGGEEPTNVTLADLAAAQGDTKDYFNFKFTGDVDTSLLPTIDAEQQSQKVEYNMVLKFQSLDLNGNTVPQS